MTSPTPTCDVVIIGAGMGGSTTALTLAPTGASILILEQGVQIRTEPLNRDTRAIFQKSAYTPQDMEVHRRFIERFKGVLREIGFKRALHRTFDEFAIGHQCGTLRMGHSAADSVVDPLGRSHDVENLFVVDGGVFVSSAAVNPALTIAALSLRTADNIARTALAH